MNKKVQLLVLMKTKLFLDFVSKRKFNLANWEIPRRFAILEYDFKFLSSQHLSDRWKSELF